MAREVSSMIPDYIIFVAFIAASTFYPIWNDMRTKKEATKDNYVFAKGRVSMFAMMLSIARGTLGVRAFIGYPSEMYYRGSGMWETLYGLLTAYPIVCFVFVPVYCSLGITSVYQYLDLRFHSRLVRCLASGTFIVRNLFILGITVYVPCVALNTVVGLHYMVSICFMTVAVILFTLFGGLKAAITADAIQGLIMIIVSMAVIIQGAYDVGGVDNVVQINKDNDRLKFFQSAGDITTRVDTPSAWIGQMFMSLSVLGCQQNLVQRYLSMKSVKQVRATLLTNMPFITVLFSLSWVVGMVIYSSYYLCDPMESGYIKKMDEILPFYVEDKLSYIPGVLGLFMATLFNGALCLAVSNTNSLATVTWEDFVSHIPAFRNVADRKQLYAIKSLGVLYCIITLGFAVIVSLMSGVIECAMLTSSATSGPLVGVFLLAMLIPIANAKGAATGMIAAHMTTFTLAIGNQFYKFPPVDLLPTSIEGCTNETFSPWITRDEFTWLDQFNAIELAFDDQGHNHIVHHSVETNRTTTEIIFNITYMYYAFIGASVTVVVGIIVSVLTKSDADKYDHKLLHPAILKIWSWVGNPKGLNDEVHPPTYTLYNTTPKLSICEQLERPSDKTLEKDSKSVVNGS